MIGMTSRAIVCAAICLAALLFVSPAAADRLGLECNAITEIPVDERIAACTSVLEAGEFGQQGTIRARLNRGGA